MNEYRYKLASNKFPKLDCPICGAKKHWQRYLDIETGEVLPEQYGLCDNASKCGEGANPYTEGYAKMIREQKRGLYSGNLIPQPTPRRPQPKLTFIPNEELQLTLHEYEQNVFIQNLLSHIPFPFEIKEIERVISLYYLGTVSKGYRAGAITLPFIDKNNNVRTIQVKQFDQSNHTTGTDFLHSIIEKDYKKRNKLFPKWLKPYNKNKLKVSCLFGEHLLNKYPHNPIALAEAPKTAIYGTLYFGFPEQNDDLLWLAVYNMNSLTFTKVQALQGREVYLFPDLSKDAKAFELWSNKAMEFESKMPGTRFIVSDLLEKNATDEERTKGLDFADYLTKLDWQHFRTHQNIDFQENEQRTLIPPQVKLILDQSEEGETLKKDFFSNSGHIKFNSNSVEQWDVTELEIFFEKTSLPEDPIKLNKWTTIVDIRRFLDSHFAAIKMHNGNRFFMSHLNRLKELKELIDIVTPLIPESQLK